MKLDWRSPAFLAVAAAVVLIVGGPGTWYYLETQKAAQRGHVAGVVGEVTEAIGLALSVRGGEGEAAQLDAMVAEAERRIARLRDEPKKRDADLFEAAEGYAVDAQRVMRRQAEVVRARSKTAASQNALMEHMAQAGNRSSEWIAEAVARRQRLEKDFYDFRAAANSYASALDAMPASRKRIADLKLGAPLYDEAALGKVQVRATADAKEAAEGLESLKRLPPPR